MLEIFGKPTLQKLKLFGEKPTLFSYIYYLPTSVGSIDHADQTLTIQELRLLDLEHRTSIFDTMLEVIRKPTFPKVYWEKGQH